MKDSHKEVVGKYFSETARYWKYIYHGRRFENVFPNYWMKQRLALVLERVTACADDRPLSVLDVGCGHGILLEELAKHGHDAIGIDINPSMVRTAREASQKPLPGRMSCLISDCEALPFPDDHFDVVACVGVLQYLEREADCLKELNRVSKPGGRIIVTLPNIHPLHILLDPYYVFKRVPQYLGSRLSRKERTRFEHSPFRDFGLNTSFLNRRYYWGQLRPVFKKCGLKELSALGVAFSLLTWRGRPALPGPLSCQISARLRRLSMIPGFRWLTLLSDRWVICLTKIGPERSTQGKCL
jgi:ubiquinone/menaquinone biosynthesis C-methylase UbiE